MEADPDQRYREWRPPDQLAEVVDCLWASGPSPTGHRVVPDGRLDIVWIGGSLVVAGPDTHATWVEPNGPAVGLRFRPGRAEAGLGVPPSELLNGRVQLEDLWGGPSARRLAEQLADAPSDADARAVLAGAVGSRTDTASTADPLGSVVADLLLRRDGRASIAAVATHVGVGERQLRARFVSAVGYGPKMFARVVRFGVALDRIRTSADDLATVAAEAGYADQAHLSREVRALAGATPAELRAETFKTALVPSEA